MAEEQGGFLGRWARRKTDVLQGKSVDEPVVVAPSVRPEPVANQLKPLLEEATEKPAALSLDDVKRLTKESDFKPFMAQNVGAEVRNAAMKKLFADPHFNVMDGLDIYIDDYSKSDPIPQAMLRAMTSSKFLKLFDDDEDKEKKEDAAPRENANNAEDQTVTQSTEDKNPVQQAAVPQINSSQPELLPDSAASQQNHDNTYLRLQPDHATPGPETGRCAE